MPAAAQPKKTQQFDFYKYLGVIWRRKWLLVVPLGICLPAAILAASLYPTEYESVATLEIQDTRPIADRAPARYSAGTAAMQVRTRAMNWSAIREIVLSRKVDFGREIDPDDRRQFERIFSEIDRRTAVRPLGSGHLIISHKSVSPERNASLVNEIVKKFVGEDRREAQQRAKDDLKYYRDKLATGKTGLSEIDNQIREFNQQYPWLADTLAEIQKDYEDAEAEELTIRQQSRGNRARRPPDSIGSGRGDGQCPQQLPWWKGRASAPAPGAAARPSGASRRRSRLAARGPSPFAPAVSRGRARWS